MIDRSLLSVSRILTPRLLGLAFLLAVGLIAFAGASLVAAQRGGPGDPPAPDAYQGCVNNHTGVLRIVAEGQACQDHETAIALGSGGGDAALLERIEELESENDALQQENAEQQGAIDALDGRLAELEANQVVIPACLTTEAVAGQERDDIVFEGCNVHVQSGAGATDAEINGLGNLIVGYNEAFADSAHTGSHNLVVGPFHSYPSYGGLVAGVDNEINGPNSSVSGGAGNSAEGDVSSISGGANNDAFGDYSSISGGVGNNITASGHYSSISGGQGNTASGGSSSISGGYTNEAIGLFSSVSGGISNLAGNSYSSVSGGNDNTASGLSSSVSGGYQNTASNSSSSVSGGHNNTASGTHSSISGGNNNTASGGTSSASGGQFNIAFGDGSSVGGGNNNTARANYSSVSGGNGNLVDTDGLYGSISGGLTNIASGPHSSVSGGEDNIASGAASSVGGGISVVADGTYEFLP